jgi:hypothetical protein
MAERSELAVLPMNVANWLMSARMRELPFKLAGQHPVDGEGNTVAVEWCFSLL